MEKLRVSIVTVCLNEIGSISDSVESVLSQTYERVEYIVFDGGSADGTLEYLLSKKGAFSYFESNIDGGIYHAMNSALEKCTGDIVYFLNAGDMFFSPETVENAVHYFEKNPSLQMLLGKVRYVNDHLKKRGADGGVFQFSNIHELCATNIPQQCVFARMELYSRIGLFDLRYRICADYDWLIRAYLSEMKLEFVVDVFCNFDGQGVSNTQSNRRLREKRMIVFRNTGLVEFFKYSLRGMSSWLRSNFSA
ncbi:MAG: glycosyltransferase family 2 protein [Halioglobus sp.]